MDHKKVVRVVGGIVRLFDDAFSDSALSVDEGKQLRDALVQAENEIENLKKQIEELKPYKTAVERAGLQLNRRQ